MQTRTILATLVAGLMLAVSFIVSAASGANAAQDQAVIAGATNTATQTTVLQNTGGDIGFRAEGTIGLYGYATQNAGVIGNGVMTGVEGFAPFQDSNGVWGHVEGAGSGVYGETSGTGNGVLGFAPTATGVKGQTTSGTGVLATAANSGTALSVSGKTRFSRSGRVSIAYPAKTAVVTGVPVTGKSLVIATAQSFVSGVYVVAAVPNLGGSSNSFTIYLNKAPGTSAVPKAVTVAWYVVETP
jgi:hypothetical protein